jgi:glycosyltransferase involved in cell wall biosynthesis
MLSITVMICTYRRPLDLQRCLAALDKQTRQPDEIIVVRREGDHETEALFAASEVNARVRVLRVFETGVVAARNTGLNALRTDLVAITDDDTAPYPCWLERIERHFLANERLGGLGGRDRRVNHPDCDRPSMTTVGKLQFCGRHIGNHDGGFGLPREVDLLKGANMSYRTKAIADIRFDIRLRGRGVQAHEDMAFSLAVRHAGWQIIYDPELLVDHYEGRPAVPRHYAAMLSVENVQEYGYVTYNYVIAIHASLSPLRRAVYVIWQFFVGTRVSPGLLQAIRFTRTFGRSSWQRFWLTQKAMAAAYLDLWKAGSPAGSDRANAPRRAPAAL